MSVFSYNPDQVRVWANNVVNYLNGGSESVQACSRKFSEQVERLVQPNVWTGAAAAKNYQNFLETHQALINFVNNFGRAFEETMNEVNKNVQNLEVTNLGADSNVGNTFGTLSYSQLQALSAENINKEVVRYDYATISTIGSELSKVVTMLNDVYSKLNTEINKLNNGSSIWDGTSAENAKETLLNTLKTNMDKVMEALNVCVNNISEAASLAQMADN